MAETYIGRRAAMLGGMFGIAALATGCTDGSSTGSPSTGPTAGSETVTRTRSPGSDAAGSESLARTGAPTPEEIGARATVPVLCYHQLREYADGDSDYARAVLICPPATFREHLDAIKDDGWTTIGPDDYYDHLTTGSPLPDKPVILTFDDGTIGQVTEGMTQLVERDMTGTFFPMTVVLDQPDWMSTDDIGRLADAGMTIGAHTWDHQNMTDLSGDDWRVQLEEPRETLRQASGQDVDHLAYPYGSWNRAALPHVAEAGYKTAYQLTEDPLDQDQPLLSLRRSLARSDWTGAQVIDHLTNWSAGDR